MRWALILAFYVSVITAFACAIYLARHAASKTAGEAFRHEQGGVCFSASLFGRAA
ncbi:MAG: hypothetical protein JNJ83_22075 [Verrucomicrobiaceae bacterium]|nr:hypothetical protein [Verrucomicrobiaceae bacterium]